MDKPHLAIHLLLDHLKRSHICVVRVESTQKARRQLWIHSLRRERPDSPTVGHDKNLFVPSERPTDSLFRLLNYFG